MKTIEELNTKWWYRILKVGYFIALVLTLIGYLTAIFFSYNPTLIKSYDPTTGLNAISLDPQFDKYRINTTPEEITALKIARDKFNAIPNKKLTSIYNQRDWRAIIRFSLLSIIITLLFFESIRRIFYYILFGKFSPNKK